MTKPHYWFFCSLCDIQAVICGTCGNNTCNSGHGKLEDGSECPDCESAYELFYKGPPDTGTSTATSDQQIDKE